MAIKHDAGGTTFTGEDTHVYRRMVLKKGMEMEFLHGMRMSSKVPSAFLLVKREEGFKGSKPKIYRQFCEKYKFEMKEGMWPTS